MADTELRRAIGRALREKPDVPSDLLRAVNGGRSPRPQDLARLTEKARGALRAQRVAQLRAGAAVDAAEAVREGAGSVPATLPTGEVVYFESVRFAPGYEDGTAVIVRPLGAPANGGGDVVIVNPPTLVPDPAGEIVVDGRPYREDPLGALALAIQRVYTGGGR